MFLTGQDEIDKAVERLHQAAEEIDKKTAERMVLPDLMVLPCYGALPHDQQVGKEANIEQLTALQGYIFDDPPEGCRKLVVATNIAETSLTVPGASFY